MNFDEPGLEELIQHDLHNEMTRILSESDVDDLESNVSKSGHFYTCSETSSIQSPMTQHEIPRLETASSSGITVSTCDDTAFDMISTSMIQPNPTTTELPEITGTFSLHRMNENDLPRIAEHSDLSSLSWLTSVDVQNIEDNNTATTAAPSTSVLQKHLTAHSSSVKPGQDLLYDIPDTMTTQQNQPCETIAAAKKIIESKPVMCDSTQRYTPIQPSYQLHDQMNYQQQRYHLHSESMTAIGQGHLQGHRYMYNSHSHPYAPPMYPQSMGYNNAPYIHSRFHPGLPQKVFPKPVYSYSCLIAMALKHSKTGCLPVSDIYNYMIEHFPYFKTAPDGWKNSVRHNLSLNKCFEKASCVEKPNGTQRKGCLWALNPTKIAKMEEEVQKWKRKDPESVRRSMSKPEELDHELEEMRRNDEENARRRMLTLSSHGITTHRHFPYHVPAQYNQSQHARGQSLPSSPQRNQRKHFSPQLAQQHLTLALARSSSQPPPLARQMSAPNHARQESLPADLCPPTNLPVTSTVAQKLEFKEKPCYSGSLAQSLPEVMLKQPLDKTDEMTQETHADFGDIDLDTSLEDLEMLQSTFWDDELSLDSHDQQSATDMMSKLSDGDGMVTSTQPEQSTTVTVTTENTIASETKQSNIVSPNQVFPSTTDSGFRPELNYFNNNISTSSKPVMLH